MSLRKIATSGLIWTFAQQFGNQLIGFIVSVILARILLPAEFGLIGMIAVFIAIGNTLLNAGLTQSLIRSKEIDQEDYSTVFYFNLVISVLIYFIVFFSAPGIAEFYGRSILTDILRVYGLTFIISAFSAVHQTILTKELDFRLQTTVAIPAAILGGGVGILLALNDYGVWSLVWSSIATAAANSVQFWIYSKWLPEFIFNRKKFLHHFNYGYKLTLSGLLDQIFNNIYLIIIGKYFSVAQVGFYTRAETMKQLPVSNISFALNKVTFPLFATIQDKNERLKKVYKDLMEIVIFIISPVLIFTAVLAEPIFRILFTEKWLPAVPYYQILCFTGILYPVHAYNLNILKIKGRSDIFLKLTIFKKSMTLIVILIAFQFGIYGLLYAQVLLSVLGFFINAHYTNKFIAYSALDQFRDISPIILTAGFWGLLVLFFDFYIFNKESDFLRIVISGLIGVVGYLFSGFLFRFESLKNIKKIVFK